jgi:hypothetical protein
VSDGRTPAGYCQYSAADERKHTSNVGMHNSGATDALKFHEHYIQIHKANNFWHNHSCSETSVIDQRLAKMRSNARNCEIRCKHGRLSDENVGF